MISIRNLTKIYKSKNKFNCTAIDSISFDLPSSGMIFVLGKSGSGKSTLLNLIGGLDGFDGGEITFEGARLSEFTGKDYYDYRGNHLGFVFQDYHLLDELTISENITLALDIADKEHGDKISAALGKVGMQGYETRYPKELSGGQKQRIAMARAIVKDSDVILCDEPTGNLDAGTSRMLLELLKEASKTKLVIIVSHNLNDAITYADRIIELASGKISRDVTREEGYLNEFRITDKTLSLPYNKNLTESQLTDMVESIRTGEVERVVQNDDGFRETEAREYEAGSYDRKRTRMTFGTSSRLARIFMKNKHLHFFITAFMVALIVSCFAVFQSFLSFDGNKALAETLVKSEMDAIVYQKGQKLVGSELVDTNYLLYVTDEDIAKFKDAGYEGNIYKLYDHAIAVLPNSGDVIGAKKSRNAGKNVTSFYIGETFGVLECDKEFLTKKFGKDGELTVLAGDISQPNKGVIITDYIADSIIFGNQANPGKYPDYNSILGSYTYVTGSKYAYIDAIIETGYKERYSEFKDRITDIQKNSANYEADLAELASTDEFARFAEEVQLYLGISYTFSDNYLLDMSTSIDFLEWGFASKLQFNMGDVSYVHENSPWITTENKYGKAIGEGEAILPYPIFNAIAGTTYTPYNIADFTPTEISVSVYSHDDVYISSKIFTVTGLTERNYVYVNSKDFLAMRPSLTCAYSLYFDNVSMAGTLNTVAEANNFVPNSIESHNASKLNKVVITFEALFEMFEIFLLAICVIYLAVFGANIIRKNRYQIGVIKALGGKTNQIARIFISQLLAVGIMIFIMSGIGIYIATALADEILISSVRTHLGIYIYQLTIIDFIPKLAILDMIAVLIITVLSSLVPLIAIHKIKPINIIKAKE